jgi:hypothetical protein
MKTPIQQIEKASEYYAHNYFDMHETNSYKELKRGFEAGVEWARKNILIMDKDTPSPHAGRVCQWCDGEAQN